MAVKVVAGSVVTHRRPRVGVAGGDLDVSQVHASIKHRGDESMATAGSFVFVPRDRLHGFTVTSGEPARAIVITGPSQLDQQITAHGTSASP